MPMPMHFVQSAAVAALVSVPARWLRRLGRLPLRLPWRGLAALVVTLAAALLGGCGMPSFLVTPVSSSQTLKEEVVEQGQGWSAQKIVVIQLEGLLANVKSGGLLKPTENDLSLFTQELEKAEKDPEVKALVLRINSPGGTVTTSDTMYQMVRQFKERTHRPVVSSAQEVCASGAYYIACASDKIVTHPTSVVGSIGVIFNTLDLKDGLDRLGIRSEAIRSGPLKDMGSPFRHPEGKEKEVMQGIVNEYFDRFAGVVGGNRPVAEKQPPPLPMPETYGGIYSGRVFSGREAVKLGLADQEGMLSDAIRVARDLAHAPKARVVMYRRPYGYGGSIYAQNSIPAPRANVLQLEMPGLDALLPGGFYYLWRP